MSIMSLRRATGTDPAMTATTTDTTPLDATAVTETTTMSAIGTTTATNRNVRPGGQGARASVAVSVVQEDPGPGQYHNVFGTCCRGLTSSPRSRSPQLTEDERDRRTVFVQQLAARLRSKELIAFFEKVGPVKEAQIVKDRVSGRSKGYVLVFCPTLGDAR